MVCQLAAVPAVALAADAAAGEPSSAVRARVADARERQSARLGGVGAACNAELDGSATRRLVAPGERAVAPLLDALDAGILTGRGHDRVLRVARTIADLAGRERVDGEDVSEALGYRAVAPGRAVA